MENSKPDPQRSDQNIVITGFMGTGKTTVGERVAARLDRPFIDMDVEIEYRAGMTIREIFDTQGENAFRQRERVLCRELAAERALVIATGGGTLLDPANRRLLMESGLVVCLSAAPDVLLERLKNDMTRPLLQAPDPTIRLRELLEARAEAYAALPHHLDTTHRSPEQVVEAVLELWRTSFP